MKLNKIFDHLDKEYITQLPLTISFVSSQNLSKHSNDLIASNKAWISFYAGEEVPHGFYKPISKIVHYAKFKTDK